MHSRQQKDPSDLASRSPIASRLAKSAAVLCLLLAACAPDRPGDTHPGRAEGAAPPVQRLELSGPDLAAEERLLAELVPNETWTSTAANSYLGPAKAHGPGPFLRLNDDGALVVRIPIEPEFATFNRVDIDLLTRTKRAALVLRGRAGDEMTFRTMRPLQGRNIFQRVSIHVPYWARSRPTSEAIELEVQKAPRVLYARVRLVEEAWTSRLPSPEPALVAISGDTRMARGISTAAPLTAQVRVPENGVLHIAAGIPIDLRRPRGKSELVVRLGRGDGLVERRLSLVNDGPGGWTEQRIELTGVADQLLPLRFELVADSERESYAVVATPLVTGRHGDPRTIVLITSDTHRHDYLGAATGGVEIETPTLDALAEQGVLYESCFAATNVTIPSHASLLTGVHVRDTRIVSNFASLADAAPTLAERFQDAGFVTLACVSSGHLDHARSGLGQGFDFMRAPTNTKLRAEETFARTRALLDLAEGLPVFLWVHLFDAHTPYRPPEAFDRRYYPADRDPFDLTLPDLLDGQAPPTRPRVRDLDYPRAQYRAEVAYLDHELGAFLNHGRLRTATVLFTADHGESLGQHEIYWDHAGLYPDTVQVPMLLRGPGVPAGRRVLESVRQIDAGRTLLDLAGLPGAEFPGTSLLDPLLRSAAGEELAGQRNVARAPLFAIAASGLEASIHSGPWLLILVLHKYSLNSRFVRTLHAVELFDLVADPECGTDLAAREIDTAARLRRELIAWLAASRSTGWSRAVVDDDATLRRMAELGYTNLGEDVDEAEPWIDVACQCPACSAWE